MNNNYDNEFEDFEDFAWDWNYEDNEEGEVWDAYD